MGFFILWGLLSSLPLGSVSHHPSGFFSIPKALQNFFECLFFGTVTEALSELTLTEETRRSAHSNFFVAWGTESVPRKTVTRLARVKRYKKPLDIYGSSILTGTK